MDKLLASEESSVQDVDLGLILGQSRNGRWLTEDDPVIPLEDEEAESDTDGQSETSISLIGDCHLI